MDTKLTLKLDSEIIKQAKLYASESNTSLSRMIENYLGAIVQSSQKNARKVHPLVEELTGVVQLDESMDYKKAYKEYLIEKYK